MINILTGPPRAGKTYFVVKWLLDNYFKFDSDSLEWKIKDDVLIISNIAGFKLPHKSLDKILKDNDTTAEEFFTLEVQTKLSEQYPCIIYFIDEAHKYFPVEIGRNSRLSKNLRNYFAEHGHYNQHFWLMTQDCSLIFQSMVKLAEIEYQTIRYSLRPPGQFRYNVKVPGKNIKYDVVKLRIDKKIFGLYDSSELKETQKSKRTKLHMIMYASVVVVIALSITGYLTFLNVGKKFTGEKKLKNIVVEKEKIKFENKGYSIESKSLEKKDFEDLRNKKHVQDLEVKKDNNKKMKWVKVPFVLDKVKQEIKVLDDNFGLMKLGDYKNEFKLINGNIYVLKEIEIEKESSPSRKRIEEDSFSIPEVF